MNRSVIRFDKVFSIERRQARMGGRHTLFGFESAGKKIYDVSVHGWPPIEPGMTVVAFFGKDNDWSSFLGWVDSRGHSTVQSNPYIFALLFAASALFMVILLAGGFPWPVDAVICLLFGVPATLFLWVFAKEYRAYTAVKTAVAEIRCSMLGSNEPFGGG